MKALVIGTTGFVGGAVARRLVELGGETHGLGRTGLAPTGVQAHRGTLADPNEIARAARGCDVAFHCAGETSEHADREALGWINVAGTENVVRAVQHAGVRRLIIVSCADATLLDRDRLHWKETQVLDRAPLGRVARSRLLAEELALNADSRAFRVMALRPGWVWGPGDRSRLPGLCAEALDGGIRLFGRGDNLFATTYIDTLVDALLCAAQCDGGGGNAYHVSDADFVTTGEFFGMLSDRLGLPPPRRGNYRLSYAFAWLRELREGPGPWRADVAARGRASLLDCACAHRDLDFTAGTSIDEGMNALAAWVKEQGGPRELARAAKRPAGPDAARAHEALADAQGPATR